MINKFHPYSQSRLVEDVENIEIAETGITDAATAGRRALEWFERLGKLEGEELAQARREQALDEIAKFRRVCFDYSPNGWHIYTLCKKICELAEIDRVDFNGSDYQSMVALIEETVPFVESETLVAGICEYESMVQRTGHRMNWIVEDEQNKLLTVVETVQLSQDILYSFIEHKGLTADLQVYVEQFELSQDGPAN
ncbi:hypothetical protein WMW72_34090 [Paenibacillus filicis]|uniref:Uncharacterized protein n=1 Tax=Paenibacillus filicis TaxID=669464 RepID=A0ABU9DVL3_9BACL